MRPGSPAVAGRAEAAGPAGRGGESPGQPRPPGLPGRAQAGVQRGGGPVRPRAAVARFSADLRQGTAPCGPGPPRTVVCCPTVHIPMTLGGTRAGESRGDGPPLPPPPGLLFRAPRSEPGNVRQARSPWPLLLRVPGAAPSRPTSRSRPREGPLSQSLPLPLVLPSPPPSRSA